MSYSFAFLAGKAHIWSSIALGGEEVSPAGWRDAFSDVVRFAGDTELPRLIGLESDIMNAHSAIRLRENIPSSYGSFDPLGLIPPSHWEEFLRTGKYTKEMKEYVLAAEQGNIFTWAHHKIPQWCNSLPESAWFQSWFLMQSNFRIILQFVRARELGESTISLTSEGSLSVSDVMYAYVNNKLPPLGWLNPSWIIEAFHIVKNQNAGSAWEKFWYKKYAIPHLRQASARIDAPAPFAALILLGYAVRDSLFKEIAHTFRLGNARIEETTRIPTEYVK